MTKYDFNPSSLYDRYMVRIRIRERIDGGVPKDPKLIEAWVKASTGFDDEITKKQVEEHLSELEETVALTEAIEATAERMWRGFKRDENGPYVEARQVKALLRESATLLRVTVKKRGSKQVIQHGFEVKGPLVESRIYLEKGKEGTEERPIHVMTAQGPRSALTRTDFLERCEAQFEVWILKTAPQETRHIGEGDLVELLRHAQENGLGANRSQGSGKFDVIEFGCISK